jgi:hypothetical protein
MCRLHDLHKCDSHTLSMFRVLRHLLKAHLRFVGQCEMIFLYDGSQRREVDCIVLDIVLKANDSGCAA